MVLGSCWFIGFYVLFRQCPLFFFSLAPGRQQNQSKPMRCYMSLSHTLSKFGNLEEIRQLLCGESIKSLSF
ncbi:hypothetical protein EDC96DRAFT_492407 [Choanephora cucurbitarum]|nr:hypothetical protein EDC96DRAFT_492407 [Choanephora cucurbitarum]